MNKCLLVFGMHRSGTSALMGLLNILGVHLGSNTLLSQPDNPKGFFESSDIVTFNDKILSHLHSAWDDASALPDKWWLNTGSFKDCIRDIIRKLQHEIDSTSIFGIKDPRMCRLFPIWEQVFQEVNVSPHCILIFRNPIEVAQSLRKRNGFSLEKGILLWLTYVFESELYTRKLPRLFCSFDSLLDNTETSIQNFSNFLNIQFSPSDRIQDNVDKFIEKKIKHHNITSENVNRELTKLSLSVFNIFTGYEYEQTLPEDALKELDYMREHYFALNRFFFNDDVIKEQEQRRNLESIVQRQTQQLSALQEMQTTLNNIYQSNGWKALTLCYKLRDYLVSFSSHKRNLFRNIINRFYPVLASLIETVQNEGGFKHLINKAISVLKQEGWSGMKGRMFQFTQSVDGKQIMAYQSYIETMEPTQADLDRMKSDLTALSYRPKFSIVVPVYNVDEKWLHMFIASVQKQIYPYWELCIADDCSTIPQIRSILLKYEESDPRIKVVFREENGHISAATNSALELATGDFMSLMDNDDEIAPNALYEFAVLLNQDPQIDMIYSDEDKIALKGSRYEPFFKPDWSPETLEGCMYTAHFACYRMSIVRELKGFRVGFEGAQDYDFVLRFTERAVKIIHTPKILYHWRAIPGSTAATMGSKDYVLDSAMRALNGRAIRVGGGGRVKLGRYPGSFDVRYSIKGSPLISIIIASAGRNALVRGKSVNLLVNVIKSIHTYTTYNNFEIIVVDNCDLSEETTNALAAYNCKFVHFSGSFNIAAKMNMGAREAQGEYLLFMNDDIEVIARDWMECMLQLAQRPGIGAVGAKLFFENNKIQHAGIAFWNGLPDHILRESNREYPGHFFSSCSNRNYLAVTGAVMMTAATVFKEVEGFDERFAINYNDIDYCLKVFQTGWRIVFASGAELYHYESVSRERVVSEEEISLFQNKWREVVTTDPYYGSYFDNHPPDFLLRNDWTSVKCVEPLCSLALSHKTNQFQEHFASGQTGET